jgi:LmbE family N-acetylglucosaminyl deacetylase
MKILATFAHPDDESYGPGGTIARATGTGHIVSLLTLTRGESGSLGVSKNHSVDKLAKRRSQELKSAAGNLGIQQVQIHNLPDNNLQDIPEEKGINIIKKEINRFKPDIIITFHENTISGHPDHLAVTNWTYTAVKLMQNPPRLFFFCFDQRQTSMVTFQKLTPIAESEITHRINVGDFINDKIAAIRCHKTQETVWQRFEEHKIDFKTFAEWEVFVQKWPVPKDNTVKFDLFES